MRLSKRLSAIADVISKHSLHGPMADIGSDHGYLPVHLVLNEVVSKAFACDIADGPLQACLATVQLSHTENKISVRKGNGLAPIINENLDVISICGMGGNLICDILEANLADVSVQTLVIEANVNEPLVRSWLNMHAWQIIDETMVEDAKHYYEIIVAQKGKQYLTEKEIYFGPSLLKQRGSIFIQKWQWQKQVHTKILESLPLNHPKREQVQKEYFWILEVLDEN